MRRVLRLTAFRRLFAGATASLLGDAIIVVAVGLYVQQLTGSASDTGLVLFAYTAPLVIAVPVGGVVADRMPRQRVLVLSDAVRAACHGLLAVLILSGAIEVWHMVVIGAVFSTAEAFFRPAFTGLVPQTVDEALIQEANSVVGVSREVTFFLGPALATALVLGLGAGTAFALDAALYLVSALLVGGVVGRERGEPVAAASFLTELREGLSAVRERAWVWVTIVVFALALLVAVAPFFTLGAGIAADRYGDPAVYGYAEMAFGGGTALGALVALVWRPVHPLRSGLLLALPWPAAFLVYALVPPLPVVLVAMALGGAGVGLFGVWWETALAQRTPPHLLSRVGAWDVMGSLALLPLGFVLAGPVAEAVGATETLAVGSAIALVALVLGLVPRETRALVRIE